MAAMLETDRLILRWLRPEDVDAMYSYLGDSRTMKHYPAPFSRNYVQQWIERNQERYLEYGYGLFGVVLKESGKLIGDCGLIWQEVEGKQELEVGYHFHSDYWGKGYAPEAARACIEFAFHRAGVDHVISLIRPENVASRRVAEKNGLHIVRRVMWKGLPHDVWELVA